MTKIDKKDLDNINFLKKELKFKDINTWRNDSLNALEGKGPLYQPLLWNAGVYFWMLGITKSIDQGIEKAKSLISSGSPKLMLQKLIRWRNDQNSI